jgi:rhodanese-related sulfurtransferase
MNKYLLIVLLGLVIVLIGAIFFISHMENSNSNVLNSIAAFSDISPDQFNQALSSGQYQLIDVRTLDEYNGGHIKNAKQSDYYQTQVFSNFLDSLDKNGKYLVYCRAGNRSRETLAIMRQKGFKTVYDLAGGYNAWVSSNLPVEK